MCSASRASSAVALFHFLKSALCGAAGEGIARQGRGRGGTPATTPTSQKRSPSPVSYCYPALHETTPSPSLSSFFRRAAGFLRAASPAPPPTAPPPAVLVVLPPPGPRPRPSPHFCSAGPSSPVPASSSPLPMPSRAGTAWALPERVSFPAAGGGEEGGGDGDMGREVVEAAVAAANSGMYRGGADAITSTSISTSSSERNGGGSGGGEGEGRGWVLPAPVPGALAEEKDNAAPAGGNPMPGNGV